MQTRSCGHLFHLALVLLALAGCDLAGGPQPTQGTETPRVERPFQQLQPPPEGRAAELTVDGGAETCTGRPGRPGSPASLQVEQPAALQLCFAELQPNATLMLQLLRPDGQIEYGAAWTDPQGQVQLPRVVLPDDPAGAYELVGRQEEIELRVMLNVAPAGSPRVAVLPQTAEPGVTFRALLAGFPAHEGIALDLYRIEGATASYLAPLGSVQADAGGEASYVLPSYSDDPTGSYWLSASPQRQGGSAGARFALLGAPAPNGAQQPRAGRSAVTLAALNLYTTKEANAPRVEARPRLPRGTLVSVLSIEPQAIKVRAVDDGVEGWLHAEPEQLALGSLTLGEQSRFVPGKRVVVIEGPAGIPLRAEASARAAKVRDLVATGQQATVEELRGDWLRVTLDNGSAGWLRWHYDGARYVDVVED